MPLVKRYPNRKLYDTEAKRYITLDEIASMIRQGQQVRVVDHTTGEDLTAVTLTQVILEQERKLSGFLPQAVLAGLIQAGGERLSSLRRALATPLDLARHVDEEIERRIQALVSRGEVAAEEGGRLRDKLLVQGQWLAGTWLLREQVLEQVLAEHGLPTRSEIQQIMAQLDSLAEELEALSQHLTSGDGPATPRPMPEEPDMSSH
jgi:polyhydroxyalkanoate synthesis repressor PhaR